MDGDAKVFLASTNFVTGIACVSAVLIALSIVPDCAGQICTQFLTYFVVQSSVHLGVLLVVTLSVSLLLAFDAEDLITSQVVSTTTPDSKREFEDSMMNFPGHLLLFGVTVAACLQFINTAHKLMSVSMPIFTLRVFSKGVVFMTIMASFLLGANRFINYTFEKKALSYSVNHFRWQFSTRDDNSLLTIVIISGCCFLTALFGLGAAKITKDNFRFGRRYFEWRVVARKILSLSRFLVADLIYAALILYSIYRAQPGAPVSAGAGFFEAAFHAGEGIVQSFLLLVWPTLTAFVCYPQIRMAVSLRTRLMLAQQQMPTPRQRRSLSPSKQYASLPAHVASEIAFIETPFEFSNDDVAGESED